MKLDCCRKIPITLKIPRLGNPSVSDTWSLDKIVRKVEFKLLHDSCQARQSKETRKLPASATVMSGDRSRFQSLQVDARERGSSRTNTWNGLATTHLFAITDFGPEHRPRFFSSSTTAC